MSLLIDSTSNDGSTPVLDRNDQATKKDVRDELTLALQTKHVQPSAMSDELKREKRANAPALDHMFDETLRSKGEESSVSKSWNSDGELEVDGLSDLTLHSFILKAEALGKKISYTKTLKVKISD